jgi:hypothetical protein
MARDVLERNGPLKVRPVLADLVSEWSVLCVAFFKAHRPPTSFYRRHRRR